MRISFFTFGCTVNNYESQELSRKLAQYGCEIVEQGETDVVIINSCVVTGAAEKGVLQLAERQRKKRPEALIIITGCYNEYIKKSGNRTAPGEGVILLDKKRPDFVEEVCRLYWRHTTSCAGTGGGNTVDKDNFRPVRAIIQVQSGCDNMCSYCVVPHVRGGSVSTPYCDIEARLYELIGTGYREFVLAGLNLGSYDSTGMKLIDVMERIDVISGVESIRLSSLEPMYISGDFIDRIPGIAKLQPHLHISLQSGCDRTLARMNRNYSFEMYENLVSKIRERIPDIAITTDIIVGFPGEGDRDFEESIENIVRCQFSDIHIFKYSARNGTAAAKMDGQVTEHKKNSRALQLKGVKQQARYNYYSRFLGREELMTPLRRSDGSIWEGVTAHNFPVFMQADAQPDGIIPVKITGIIAGHNAFTAERIRV